MSIDRNVIEGLEMIDSSDVRQNIDVDVIELRLPCRYFRIHYKVAETGQFSLTTEFLLRLLRFGDGMLEKDVGQFFAFSSEETRFVVNYVEDLGFAARRNGRVFLTDAGHAQFRSSDDPALFEVHSKQDRFEFDLVSWAPADLRRHFSPFENRLPELPFTATDDIGHGSPRVAKSFARHFQGFRLRRGANKIEKETLYSVDDVQAEQRYSALVPVTIAVRPDDPSIAEASLLDWKDSGDLQDRPEIVDACASFVKEISYSASASMASRCDWIRTCAPEQVDRFMKNDLFDAQAFFHAASLQAGELRSDRPTVRVVGNLWTNANAVRLATALKNAVRRGSTLAKMIIWLRPQSRYWGMTTRIERIFEAVRQQFVDSEAPQTTRKSVLLTDEAPQLFRDMFDAIVGIGTNPLDAAAEIFLVPGSVAFVATHVRLGKHGHGYPVPLGVMSFDPGVVSRATDLIKEVLAPSHVRPLHCGWECKSLLTEIDETLNNRLPDKIVPNPT